jgi:hypothetical protein
MAEFKIPKQLAVCADLLYTTRQERLALSKQVQELEARESSLREHLIQNLPKSQALGITGKFANATIETKEVVSVTDWDALYDYIVKSVKKDPGAWSLLQRRVGDASIKALWASNVKVPGVEKMLIPQVSLRKVS